ncbi:MAG: AAA family ATPase [Candidatus Micrarchaeales archaeon]|jgi:broad-specificity NMP kinase
MNPRKSIIAIIGVPGTGKSTLSERLKRRIGDAELIHLTRVINENKLFSSYDKYGSKIAKMKELGEKLERMIRKSDRAVVILEGHILCDMRIKDAKAIVLREHLQVIRRRLLKRGYGKGKLNSNLISEATDYCGLHARRNYKQVFEMFSSDRNSISNMVKIAKGGKPKEKKIDLLNELKIMIKKDRSLLS